jgi:uncharacterized protein
MDRNTALELLFTHVESDSLRKHSLASEAVMKSLARQLKQDEIHWGLAGLLHDLDVEITRDTPEFHGTKTLELLQPFKLPENLLQAIRMHNEFATKQERTEQFDIALAAGETITGLITATALVYPDKKLSSVKVKSIVKRMKEKNFAASVKRENILECEKIGIPIDTFATITLTAMQEISKELGM